MVINETQLETWSRQGSITQSANTYEKLRVALNDTAASYYQKDYVIFLQGSYGNSTNIYADSDVDVVIKLESIYYDDLSNLPANDLELYKAAKIPGSYSYNEFKAAVTDHLRKKFGANVIPGSKAIFIQGDGTRRDADVLPAVQFRRYLRFQNWGNQNFVDGICFWEKDGTQIINYPKLHSANCTSKHQATDGWFKPVVRMFKNMRNTMVTRGYLNEGVAPSYFIEGLLYNVPNWMFGSTFTVTFQQIMKWLSEVDRDKLVCANEQYYLVHPTSPVTWRAEHLQSFHAALINFWRQ